MTIPDPVAIAAAALALSVVLAAIKSERASARVEAKQDAHGATLAKIAEACNQLPALRERIDALKEDAADLRERHGANHDRIVEVQRRLDECRIEHAERGGCNGQ